MRVPELKPFGRSARVLGAVDGAQAESDDGQAPMVAALGRLSQILGAAVVSARELFGQDSASDPFNGLYITPVHAERALEAATAGPIVWADPAAVRPGWTEICRHDPRWHWLRTAYGLSEFELDVVLVALAPEVDLRYEKVFGYLQDDVGQRLPTVAL